MRRRSWPVPGGMEFSSERPHETPYGEVDDVRRTRGLAEIRSAPEGSGDRPSSQSAADSSTYPADLRRAVGGPPADGDGPRPDLRPGRRGPGGVQLESLDRYVRLGQPDQDR